MFFNSLHFALFLPVIFVLYWFVTQRSLRLQNMMLLAASYFFYGCWDWRFLFLLLFSTGLDYFTGLKMERVAGEGQRKFWFWLSIVINLGFLGVFKYYNFFADSFAAGLARLGLSVHPPLLSVILPVGISFYTFHGLSYVIDVYKRRIAAERNVVDYALFVSFFPLLVAGPIERATHLLPQLKQARPFNYHLATDGLRQILWGLFKKVVIADRCAAFVNPLFEDPASQNGSTLALGAVLFAVQIYGDFSGYSDIALGTARLFGIELLNNFSFPYFSRDMAEFWRRWHISLSSWFKDYLYIPLGGSKGSTLKTVRNVLIIFLVSGFWHGANWTFLVWGFLNALYILPSVLFHTNRNHLDIVARGKLLPTAKEFFSMALTFALAVLAWIFFRATSLSEAGLYLSKLFSVSLFSKPVLPSLSLLLAVALFFLMEWLGREQRHALAQFGLGWNRPLRRALYYVLLLLVLWYSGEEAQQFIYFQF